MKRCDLLRGKFYNSFINIGEIMRKLVGMFNRRNIGGSGRRRKW